MIINKTFFKKQLKEMSQVKKLLTEIQEKYSLKEQHKWAIGEAKKMIAAQTEMTRRTISKDVAR